MNKWQIICPVVSLALIAIVFAAITGRNHRRGFITMASRSIGDDLIRTTNSSHLVPLDRAFQAQLSELLSTRTYVARVFVGDEAPPKADSTACSRLVLRNESGRELLIRLGRAEVAGTFRVLSFKATSW